MSGILGVMRKDGKPVTAQTLAPIRRAMTRWDPDGYGSWHAGAVGLGHLNLRVTPESRGECQPVSLSTGAELTITADARIDNRAELLDRLGVPKGERATLPDSLLILRAYERWGATCVEQLVGAFAFVIWDARAHTLVCGRDHIGFRPFLYMDTPRFFVFASDIKGVLAYPPVSPVLYEPLLAASLQQMTYHAETRYTFYDGVVKLPPSHRLIVTEDETRLDRYWAPEEVPDVRMSSDEAYAERLRELLEQAVTCRLRTMDPVGSHLSGGLDSSAVTALAASYLRERGQTLEAFSWSPPPVPDAIPGDERVDVEAVRRRAEIPCRYHTLTDEDVFWLYRRDFTVEPTEMLLHERHVQAQAARAGIRVMLSGWGGDEVVTSHTPCYVAELLATARWRRLHQELQLAARRGDSVSRWRYAKRYGFRLFRHGITPLLPNLLYRYVDPSGLNLPPDWVCINPDFARRHEREVRALRGPGYRDRSRVRLWEIHWLTLGHLTRRIEAWATYGARRGITYGYPLLDKRLLAFCLGLPADRLYHQGEKRMLFRRALKGVLPDRVRLKPGKFEPANFAVLTRLLPEGLYRMFEQMRPTGPDPPVAAYVDVDRLGAVLRSKDEMKLQGGIIGRTVACFSVGVLKDRRAAV